LLGKKKKNIPSNEKVNTIEIGNHKSKGEFGKVIKAKHPT